MEKLPAFLKAYFWDVDFEKLTDQTNAAFIVKRVIDRGNTKALRWVLKRYPLKAIKEIVLKSRDLSRKTANFWTDYFGLDPKLVPCLKKPYSPIPFGL